VRFIIGCSIFRFLLFYVACLFAKCLFIACHSREKHTASDTFVFQRYTQTIEDCVMRQGKRKYQFALDFLWSRAWEMQLKLRFYVFLVSLHIPFSDGRKYDDVGDDCMRGLVLLSGKTDWRRRGWGICVAEWRMGRLDGFGWDDRDYYGCMLRYPRNC
jgi:hypothetical protein